MPNPLAVFEGRAVVGDDTVELDAETAVGTKESEGVERVDVPPRGGGADVGRSNPGIELMVLCISAVAS